MKTNLETVQTIYEAFGKGDMPTILSHIADDVQWEAWADNSAQKHNVPWLKPRYGKEGAMEFFGIVAQLNLLDFQILSMMDGGSKIAVEVGFRTDSTPLCESFADEEIHLWTFNEEGKVIGLRHYADTYKHIHSMKS